jgi:hypothetical protein
VNLLIGAGFFNARGLQAQKRGGGRTGGDKCVKCQCVTAVTKLVRVVDKALSHRTGK